MIIGGSKDIVLIKKIYLNIWTLRDEVQAVITARAEAGQGKVSVEDLIEEYKSRASLDSKDNTTLEVLDGGKSEGAPEAQAESKEDEAEKTPSSITVTQRRPNIPSEKLHNGTTILSELNMEEMYFFSDQNFLEGQSIVIEFLVPNRFVLNANVFYSRPYNRKSRIIRDKNFIYRVAVKFSFLKPGERTLLRQFVKSVGPGAAQAVAPPEKAVKAQGEGLDELDDLDL